MHQTEFMLRFLLLSLGVIHLLKKILKIPIHLDVLIVNLVKEISLHGFHAGIDFREILPHLPKVRVDPRHIAVNQCHALPDLAHTGMKALYAAVNLLHVLPGRNQRILHLAGPLGSLLLRVLHLMLNLLLHSAELSLQRLQHAVHLALHIGNQPVCLGLLLVQLLLEPHILLSERLILLLLGTNQSLQLLYLSLLGADQVLQLFRLIPESVNLLQQHVLPIIRNLLLLFRGIRLRLSRHLSRNRRLFRHLHPNRCRFRRLCLRLLPGGLALSHCHSSIPCHLFLSHHMLLSVPFTQVCFYSIIRPIFCK